MPNNLASLLATGQAKLKGMFAEHELKSIDPVTYRVFQRQSLDTFSSTSLNALRTAESRPVQAYFLLKRIQTALSARSHNHTGNPTDSAAFTPSWAPKVFTFSISEKHGDANIFSYEDEFNHNLKTTVKSAFTALETLAIDTVFNNRSGVNTGNTLLGTFNATQKAYEINAAANGNNFIQIATQVMQENFYRGGLTFFCDSKAFVDIQRLAAQGTSNAVNTSFQFMGHTFINSIGLTAKATGLTTPYTKGFVVAAAEGTLGSLEWIPIQNRNGLVTRLNTYGTFLNPIDGSSWAIHDYETLGDTTALGGSTQDTIYQYEISQDVALHVAPLSTANETPLQAFALV